MSHPWGCPDGPHRRRPSHSRVQAVRPYPRTRSNRPKHRFRHRRTSRSNRTAASILRSGYPSRGRLDGSGDPAERRERGEVRRRAARATRTRRPEGARRHLGDQRDGGMGELQVLRECTACGGCVYRQCGENNCRQQHGRNSSTVHTIPLKSARRLARSYGYALRYQCRVIAITNSRNNTNAVPQIHSSAIVRHDAANTPNP